MARRLTKTVQNMEEFGHLVNLLAMCYDKGSRIVGMIEERLGEEAFFDFMRIVYRRYQFRILRVDDFQHELEEYTGYSWQEFFDNWLHSKRLCDWAVEKVSVVRRPLSVAGVPKPSGNGPRTTDKGHYQV